MGHRVLGRQFAEQQSLLGPEWDVPPESATSTATSRPADHRRASPGAIPGAKQLAMFMTPKELMAKYRPSPFESDMYGGDQELWEFKHQEAVDSGLVDDLKQDEVHTPIQASLGQYGEKPEILEGHHRIIAAHAVDPEQKLLPVVHYDINNERDFERQMIDHERWNG